MGDANNLAPPPKVQTVPQSPEQGVQSLFIETTDLADFPDRFDALIHPPSAVFPEPLVCIQSKDSKDRKDPKDRPDFVPEYIGKGKCGLEEAKQGVKDALDSYQQSCKNKTYDTPVSFQLHGLFRFNPQTCTHGRDISGGVLENGRVEDTPFILQNFELVDPPHDFFNIAYRLNADQIHDFRSAKIFLDVADQLKPRLAAAKERALSITYPASGSHMAPLGTALQLIDENAIDRASLIYTEIDEKAVERVEAYLKASSPLFTELKTDVTLYQKGEKGKESKKIGSYKNIKEESVNSFLLSQYFEVDSKTDDVKEKIPGEPEYEVTFSWSYRGKPMSLMMAIHRSEGLARTEYLQRNDLNLIVIHDGADRPMVSKFLNFVSTLGHPKPLWVLMESNEVDLESHPEKEEIIFNGQNYQTTFLKGLYGCGNGSRSNFYTEKAFSYRIVRKGKPSGGEGEIKLVKAERRISDPFSVSSNFDPMGSPYLHIHGEQENKNVLLVTMPSSKSHGK